jgi:hypothetical protein
MALIVRPGRVEPDEGNAHQLSALCHSERLKRRIPGVRVEPGLKLGEQLARDSRDIFDAGHGQQNALRASVKG